MSGGCTGMNQAVCCYSPYRHVHFSLLGLGGQVGGLARVAEEVFCPVHEWKWVMFNNAAKSRSSSPGTLRWLSARQHASFLAGAAWAVQRCRCRAFSSNLRCVYFVDPFPDLHNKL